MFIRGKLYSRNDIYEILKVPIERRKGAWNTGYREYNGQYFIFVGVNTKGRTGHNYNNHWEGNLLYWRGKKGSHKEQKSVRNILNKNSIVHIFTRIDNKQVKFNYEGIGKVEKFKDTKPITVYWRFDNFNNENLEDEKNVREEHYIEGKVEDMSIRYYKRNMKAREKCLIYYGYNCSICGMNFEKMYGEIGKKFIEVHNLIEISKYDLDHIIDPVNELRPVCSNCHSMLHRKNPMYTIEEMKKILNNIKSK